jgi:hypothetical protein
MGWFGSVFGPSKQQDEILSKLDPKLREFLEKESPVKLRPKAASTAADASPPTGPRQRQGEKADTPKVEDGNPVVPKQSLYQDGRYAHIWKDYRPLDDLEGEHKTGHEQLLDVLEGYKERKHLIGKAALENCALQQEAWRKCMTEGSWTAKLKMCSDEVREFERCYAMQSVGFMWLFSVLAMVCVGGKADWLGFSDSSACWGINRSLAVMQQWRKTYRCMPTRSSSAWPLTKRRPPWQGRKDAR